MFEVVRVHDEGVLGIVTRKTQFGVQAVWLIDGFRYEAFLEVGEYTIIATLKEGIND